MNKEGNYEIVVSNNCNLRCKHCGMSDNSKEKINYDLLKRTLINESHKNPIKEIYLWGGEPLLGDLDKILDIMDTFQKTKFKITTNLCYKLTDKRKEILKRCNLVSTSFDLKIRFQNIKELSLWYHNCKEILKYNKVLCICTLSTYTTSIEPKRLVKLFNEIGFTQYIFSPMILSGSLDRNKDLIPSYDEYNNFMMKVAKISDKRNKSILIYKIHRLLGCISKYNRVITNKGEIINCHIKNDCEIIDSDCYLCDNFKICGGKAPCIKECLFSKNVYDEAIRSYKNAYNETTL